MSNDWILSTDKKILIEFQIEEIETLMEADDFQRDFFESLSEQFASKQWLSEKQMACLKKIYDRVTDI